MKIIILGGYGIFGGRLCQLLATDARLSLYVAGRSYEDAAVFCKRLPQGASRAPLRIDRSVDVDWPIKQIRPDLIIDASGPFQAYGKDPYSVVKACLNHGVHYLDFADGSDFVKDIHQFDGQARAKGLFILSGVSSFPVLTAAVVRHLSQDMKSVTSIRGGIAPSPDAVMGMNVLRAICAYAGKPLKVIRNGRPTTAYAITEGMRYTIAPPGRLPLHSTYFSLVDVPDLKVLPDLWPRLQHLWMGAGPVPENLHFILMFLSWLVRLHLLPSLKRFAGLFYVARFILRWGEHRGGMFVEISGQKNDGSNIKRSWHLLAEGDDGPFIPCMALQAVVARILDGNSPAAGARPASNALELADYEQLFARRTIYTGQREETIDQATTADANGNAASGSATNTAPALFRVLMDNAWQNLPQVVQEMHDPANTANPQAAGQGASADTSQRRLSGKANVVRGKNILARLAASLFRFPAAGTDIPVDVVVTRAADHETWVRTFAGNSFASRLSLGKGRGDKLLCEKFGPITFYVALVIDGDKLRYVVRDWQIMGITLPRFLAPAGNTYETVKDGKFAFDIEIRHPLTGLIVNYSGTLVPADNP